MGGPVTEKRGDPRDRASPFFCDTPRPSAACNSVNGIHPLHLPFPSFAFHHMCRRPRKSQEGVNSEGYPATICNTTATTAGTGKRRESLRQARSAGGVGENLGGPVQRAPEIFSDRTHRGSSRGSPWNRRPRVFARGYRGIEIAACFNAYSSDSTSGSVATCAESLPSSTSRETP